MMRPAVLCVAVLSLPSLAVAAEGATAPATTAQPGDRRSAIADWYDGRLRQVSYQSDELAAAIFELLDDVTLVDVDVGKGSAKLRVGRRVYDNHDVLGSYTVIDRFRTALSYPLLSFTESLGGPYTASFSIGSKVGLDWMHIRTVLPNQFEALESPERRSADIEAALAEAPSFAWRPSTESEEHLSDAPESPEHEPPVWTLSGNGEQAFDGLTKARYGKLWNLLVLPIRTPLGGSGIERIKPGEIISYLAHGQVEIGPSLGLELNIPGIDRIFEASANVRLFVEGEYRISVWREDADHAQVKITRLVDFGRSMSIGGKSDEMIHGFVLFGHDLLHGQSTITPFRYTNSASSGRSIDLVYRYDLRDRTARTAFHRAVIGRFGPSERAAGGTRWREQSEDAPVRRIGRRITDFRTHQRETATRFGIVYSHYHETRTRDADIRLDLTDGTRRVWRSEANNGQRWRWVWGTQERQRYSFRVNVDRDRFDQGGVDAVTLSVSGEIIDSSTTATELLESIRRTESATGRLGFFPRPPLTIPDQGLRNGLREREDPRLPFPPRQAEASFGRSTFYFQVTYPTPQLERFLAIPESERWAALEDAYGVPAGSWSSPGRRFQFAARHSISSLLNLPLYVVNLHIANGSRLWEAEHTARLWRDAARETNPLKRATLLAELFSTRRYSDALARLIRQQLIGEKVSYVIQGSSYVWGKLREEGVATTAIDPLPEQLERQIDIDRRGPRYQSDPRARILGIDAKPVDHQRLAVTLRLPDGTLPRALYLRLVEQRPWRLPRPISELIVTEDGSHLEPDGSSQFTIDRRSGYLSALLEKVLPGHRYELQMAYTLDGRQWGSVTTTSFTMPPGPPPDPASGNDPLRPRPTPED